MNDNFDYVSEGKCTLSVVQQNSGSDRPQSEAGLMVFFLILSTCIQSVNGFLVCKGTVVLRWWESETKTGFPREHRKPQNSRTKTHFSSGYNLSTCNQ